MTPNLTALFHVPGIFLPRKDMAMRYSIVVCLTILLTSPVILASENEEKKATGNDRLAEADRLFNIGLKHRDRAWEYEKQGKGAKTEKDRDVYLKSAEREFKRAIESFQTATEQNSRHYEAFGSLGYAQRKVGQFKEALKAYDRALKMKPDYPEALEYRAEAYLGLNRITDARKDYTKLVDLSKDHARVFLAAASEWLAMAESSEKAIQEFGAWVAVEKAKLGAPSGKSW